MHYKLIYDFIYLLIEMMKCPLTKSDNISINNTSSDEFISVNY